jgi:hypothetical protein
MVLKIKKFCFFKNHIFIHTLALPKAKNNVSSAADLWNVLVNSGMEILNTLTSVENMLKEHLLLNFIPMKFKNYRLSIPYPKSLGPEVSLISEYLHIIMR